MKLFIHVGMNKAGSTSIQNTLAAQSAWLLENHGIYYPLVGSDFKNHYDFYELIHHGNGIEINNYLNQIFDTAVALNAKSVVLSSEDLFLMASSSIDFNNFVEALGHFNHVEKKIILVARHPRTWIKSHLGQLISNGAFAIDENAKRYLELASVVVKCIKTYISYNHDLELISYKISQADGSLVGDFFRRIGVELEGDWERVENQTGSERFFSMEGLIGLICGFRAFNHQVHPNSPEIDILRGELRDLSDSLSRKTDVAHLLNPLERNLRHDLELLIENSILQLSKGDLDFLNLIDDRGIFNSNQKSNDFNN